MEWFVYLLRCNDASLYCGITTDLTRRLYEHNHTNRGAAYTRSRRPVSLAWEEQASCREDALRREAQIKKLTKADKEQLVRQHSIEEPRPTPDPLFNPAAVSIVIVEARAPISEDANVQVLWDTLALVRDMDQTPRLWKLDRHYMHSACDFLATSFDALALGFLWDISVDLTTGLPGLIADSRLFPVLRLQP